jgi:hypothetical protein
MHITLEQFNAYRKVQFGGRFNMFSREAIVLSGLPKDVYFEILQTYETLQTRYGKYNG